MSTEKTSLNNQDHPHQEGTQNNRAPQSTGQSQSMNNMKQESEEQKAGRADGQKDESDVQQEERQP
ncbi:MAG TPA: hypothetical protein VHK91_04085 [Flavisolibacter sp.]|nr:hypothetical protein [Flavisolibacter sp.]